ncbi:Stk1 family PASTA domain-containing Ser/Thr kinase [Pseudofrankia sp. BMG5.37]|uniref:Stk1 family PASTA domain-containing Ser/Thr kinase n=1 Tax=Pseudofrankia sp. BMG5.37 TaxID=3050035 RepID=UPI0028960AA2|nr:Stk1 family PASTA domain-containing Ser/Thr kinase [Pseudofrankia sp. BMG5.37]MDT3437988.1 Stk1 family PASTA domain-containing Ser/Thr kinase [Pseudofrankia sp. BMG5.37]
MDATVADPVIGRLLDGRYTAQERLAVGGMASVYIAHDNRLDRMVALKVMHPNLMHEPDFVARFHREARAVARLNSPRVVQVMDQGAAQTPVGVLNYLVMELVRGRSLRQHLGAQGRLAPYEAIDIMEAVAEALAAAHLAGIIHRDIKPENILLGDDGQVKVADFGLARPITQPTAALTQGVVMGTVGYLAPEQVTHGVADYRSDVYAAGVVLFEMLTGQLPHTGATPMSVAYQSVHSEIPAPSTIVGGVEPELDDLVLRSTARQPDQRPSDGVALLDEVRRVLPFITDPGPAGAAAPYQADYPPAAGLADRYPPTRIEPRPGEDEMDGYLDTPGFTPAPAGRGGGHRAAAGGRGGAPAYGNQASGHRGGGIGGFRPPAWAYAVLAVVVVLILLIVGAKAMLGGGGGAEVPLLTGLTKTDAEAELRSGGLKWTYGTPVHSSTVPKDKVADYSPSGSTKVNPGDTVTIILSLGPEQVAIPNLKGQSQAAAQAKLQSMNLGFAGLRQQPSDDVEKDKIIGTDPQAGTKVDPGTQVTLLVSSGPAARTVPEDLVGTTYDDAKAELEELGFTVQRDIDTSGAFAKDKVVRTSPDPGQQLNPGGTVTLFVSVVAGGGDGSGVMVTVPNLKGKSTEQAQSILQNAGLEADIQNWFFGRKVKSTNPPAGTSVERGTTIHVTMG